MARVIIEGPNGVGKTTLALKLSDRLGLGYYRRRTQIGMYSETLEVLQGCLDCVVDRAWLTDLHYSTSQGRVAGYGRADLYRFGLLASSNCALLLKMVTPEESELERKHFTVDNATMLSRLYRKMHWSEPAFSFTIGARPPDAQIDQIETWYLKGAEVVDSCPSPGIGSAGPCDILFMDCYSSAMGELLYLLGIEPRRVHFASSPPTGSDDYSPSLSVLTEHFKPKAVVPPMKHTLNSANFVTKMNQLRDQLADLNVINAGVPTPLDCTLPTVHWEIDARI